jgi:hypothetical protein
MINTSLLTYILYFFPSLILAGRSTASPEEIEEQIAKKERLIKETAENKIERQKIDEQNTFDGDTDSPNEAKSAEELEHFDERIRHDEETIMDIIR